MVAFSPALEIALGIQMPVRKLLVGKLVRESAQPRVDIKGLPGVRQTSTYSFLAGEFRNPIVARSTSPALFAVHAYQLAAVVVGPCSMGS